MNLIPSNRHELFPPQSNQHGRSRFAQDLENIIADLGFEGGLKMLLIRSTQIVSPAVDLSCKKSICARLR